MRVYDWSTGEFIEKEVLCDICGEIIDSSRGYRVSYIKDENDNDIKVQAGSCCTGKIQAYNKIGKSLRKKYREQGQIPDSVLKKMPRSPKPLNRPDREAGKEIHQFLDTVGRSKLTKETKGSMKIRRKVPSVKG
jgi:hypothetical protein